MKQHLTKEEFAHAVEAYPQLLAWCENAMESEIRLAYPAVYDVDFTYVDFYAWFTIGRMIELLSEHSEDYCALRRSSDDLWQVLAASGRETEFTNELCDALWNEIMYVLKNEE